MFVQFTLNKIEAQKVRDHVYNPFDKTSEFYQTWQICDLEPLVPVEEEPRSAWARQGHSVTGAPDDGVHFKQDEVRRVDDPHITFNLPDLEDGETRRFRLDIHWWESDSSTEKVRGVFTDATLKVLVKAWNAAQEDQTKAKEQLDKWIRENRDDIAKAVARAAGVAGQPWVAVGLQMLPLFQMLVDVVRNDSDDYMAMHRFILTVTNERGSLKWRVVSADGGGVPEWIAGQGTQRMELQVADAGGRNAAVATYRCRVLM